MDETTRWGLYHYRKHKSRRIQTLIKVFSDCQEARDFMLQWRARGPTFVSPCSKGATPCAKGRAMLADHIRLLRPVAKDDIGDAHQWKFNSQNFINSGVRNDAAK